MLNALDENFLIEAVAVDIVRDDAEMADAASDRVISGRRENMRRVGAVLNLAEKTVVNLGQLLRRFAPGWDGLDAGRILAHAIRHLVYKLRQPIDGKAGPVLRFAL